MTIAIVLVVAAVLIVAFFLLKKSGGEAPATRPTEARPELRGEAARQRPGAAPQAASPQPASPRDQAPAATGAAADVQAETRGAPEEPQGAPAGQAGAEPLTTDGAVPVEAPAEVGAPRRPMVDVEGMRRGLARSRSQEGFFGRLRSLFAGARQIDESIAQEIEEVLLTSDVGVSTTRTILDRIREDLERGDLSDPSKVWEALRREARRILEVDGRAGPIVPRTKPTVVLLVGVNGAGKTTTIGKLATKLVGEGNQVLLAAGDTFRAAAVQQLKVWGERVGCDVVAGKDASDPSSVIFDAVRKGEELDADVVLADTAGRLHTKTNLMAEMQKIARSASKALAGAPHETLLVIDATNGQNALAQAKEFAEALDLTGIVLTKLDGTAKGGVVLGICDTLRLPVRYVGLGERADDLHEFSPEAFVEALLGRDEEDAAA